MNRMLLRQFQAQAVNKVGSSSENFAGSTKSNANLAFLPRPIHRHTTGIALAGVERSLPEHTESECGEEAVPERIEELLAFGAHRHRSAIGAQWTLVLAEAKAWLGLAGP